MSEQPEKTYRPWDPERYRHEAQSPAAKLPAGDLVFFLLDTVPQLNLRRFYAPYETEMRGAVSDHRGSNSQPIDFESVKIYPIFTAKNENHGKSNT